MPLLSNSVASIGNLKMMENVANQGADFNHTDYRGRSAIHIAVINGHLEIVRFLVQQYVNLDLIDNSGRSALYYACKYKRGDIAELLIEKGATVIVDQEELISNLCIATAKGDLELLKLFKKSEVDLNVENYDGHNLEYIAKVKGHIEI